MKAGVVAVQGAAPEHVRALSKAISNMGISGSVVTVRRPEELQEVSCVVIPGGESTTISKLLRRFDLQGPLIRRGQEGMPIMGTCAGCVLLAKEGDEEVEKTGTQLLGLMDMAVDRNAFGRQRESFEAPLDIKGLEGRFPGVFIRGPVIRRVWGGCEVLCRHDDKIVMVRQGNIVALSFHPELSGDTRIHEMFLAMV
ncbi:MAG: pyridoxal 5'-phosphate synthase glutaminase subunit PdxT [Candidatus Saccharibacteria bacterium]